MIHSTTLKIGLYTTNGSPAIEQASPDSDRTRLTWPCGLWTKASTTCRPVLPIRTQLGAAWNFPSDSLKETVNSLLKRPYSREDIGRGWCEFADLYHRERAVPASGRKVIASDKAVGVYLFQLKGEVHRPCQSGFGRNSFCPSQVREDDNLLNNDVYPRQCPRTDGE
jgi:hypothetical protein